MPDAVGRCRRTKLWRSSAALYSDSRAGREFERALDLARQVHAQLRLQRFQLVAQLLLDYFSHVPVSPAVPTRSAKCNQNAMVLKDAAGIYFVRRHFGNGGKLRSLF